VSVLGRNAKPTASKSTQTVEEPDRRGTDRVAVLPVVAHLDGQEATVVNLSDTGAQMVSTSRFKPNQRVRVFFPNESGLIRCHAVIAWAMFEIPKKGDAVYRLGVHFTDGDAQSLAAFCQRHKAK
jgi:hypothetical protein